MKKRCVRCKKIKKLEEFYKNKTIKDGYNTYCKICHKKHNKKVYYENHAHTRTILNNNRRFKMAQTKIKLFEYLKNKKCKDCKEDNPIVLDFHHLRDKRKAISQMIRRDYAWKTILDEIKKCIILCANCHRIRTAKEQNWHAYINEDIELHTMRDACISKKSKPGSSSKYKGVSWGKRDKIWSAKITVNYKLIHLGSFKDEKKAAAAYNKAAKKYHGKNARLNKL